MLKSGSGGPLLVHVPSDVERKALLVFAQALEASVAHAPYESLIDVSDLSHEAVSLLAQVAHSLADGQPLAVLRLQRSLTTQEAADLLSVSRPTLIKILEGGRLEYTRVGRHRRILLEDLLEYQAAVRRERQALLDEMTRDAQTSGLDDLLDRPPNEED